MNDMRLGVIEARFADIIWQHEPLSSGELVKLCERELTWKKSTTYTVLKKLCERGIFQNDGGTVTSKLSKEEFWLCKANGFCRSPSAGRCRRLLRRSLRAMH